MPATRYSPAFAAQAFGQVKDTDSSLEYAAIKDAFDAIDAQSVQLASVVIGTNRNILVDPSGVIGTANSVIVMLPPLPTVGDPPCRVTLLSDSYSAASNHSAVYVQGDTGNNDPIMGSLDRLPRMYNAGATMEFMWVGGAIGWIITDCQIGVYTPGARSTTSAPAAVVGAPERFPFPYMDIVLGAGLLPAVLYTNLLKGRGQWWAFTLAADGGGVQASIGTAADLVNNVVGPVVFNTVNQRFVVTNLGLNGAGPGYIYEVA